MGSLIWGFAADYFQGRGEGGEFGERKRESVREKMNCLSHLSQYKPIYIII